LLDTHNPILLNVMLAAPTLMLALVLVTGRAPGRSRWMSRNGAPLLYWSAAAFLTVCMVGLWVTFGPGVIAADWPR
jgi:hypothetical protein